MIKILDTKPCIELDDKITVTIDTCNMIDLKNLKEKMLNTRFKNVILFEKSNAIWAFKDLRSISIFKNGKIEIHGAESIDDAIKISKEINVMNRC